jgi:hypothetical protein
VKDKEALGSKLKAQRRKAKGKIDCEKLEVKGDKSDLQFLGKHFA